MTAETIKLAIVDDHPAVRAGLTALLGSEPGITLTGAVAGARSAVSLIQKKPADLVVLDYHLPDEDGITLCLRLKNEEHPPQVLIYSGFADDQLAIRATVAGADTVLSKSADPDELLLAVHAIAAGEARPPRPSPEALQRAGSRLDPEDVPVLGMLAHRIPPPEIAETLGVSQSWLAARRWAMLERLSGRPARRGSEPRRKRNDPPVAGRS
jgi:DNA-binding NarL/FixJ family response regulator